MAHSCQPKHRTVSWCTVCSVQKGKFSNSWHLAKTSWKLLRQDPELLWLPVMSAVTVTVVGITGLIALSGSITETSDTSDYSPAQLAALGILAALCTISSVFFQGALCSGAYDRMSGGDPTVRSSLSHAFARLPSLVGWAIMSTVVSLLMSTIANRVGIIGRIVTRIIDMAWDVVTYLVVPAIVVSGYGPTQALKRSARLLKDTWGENLISQAGLSALMIAVMLPAIFIAIVSVIVLPAVFVPVAIAACVIAAAVALIVISALAAYYKTALYVYSEGEETQVGGFSEADLAAAFSVRS